MEGVSEAAPENMDTHSHTPCLTNDAENDDVDDDISVGSHSPRPPPCNDTDDSMIDVDDSCTEDSSTRDKAATSPKQEPPDPVMSPGGPPSPRATPPVAHQPNNNQLLQRALKFSIDNILKPDFGIRRLSESSDCSLEQPVDLSRVTHRDTLKAFGLPAKTIRSLTTQPQQNNGGMKDKDAFGNSVWPAWVYCTRYSDRPSAGPRTRRIKKRDKKDEKRPRTAFTSEQLARLKKEFQENGYLTEKRRQDLARDLGLNESQIKIWFQNKRAKIKKNTSSTSSNKNPLALQLMAQGLYNHATIPIREEDEEKLLLPPV